MSRDTNKMSYLHIKRDTSPRGSKKHVLACFAWFCCCSCHCASMPLVCGRCAFSACRFLLLIAGCLLYCN